LVRQAAGDLAPGGVPLRLQEGRDVIEYDDIAPVAFFSRQRRAGAHEVAPRERAMRRAAFEIELLAPLLAAACEAHGERGDELSQALVARRQLRQGAAGRRRKIGAQDG